MLDKKCFETIHNEFEQKEKLREELIRKSRDVLKLSKSAIYELHREKLSDAEVKLAEAKSLISEARKLEPSELRSHSVGAYSEAIEEFVEASCYLSFLKLRCFPSPSELGVDSSYYLLGLCDVVGELVRKAVNSSIAGDFKMAEEIRSFVNTIYQELLLFDFPNTQLRRKFDSIKYGLEKLESLVLELKLKDKLVS